MEVVSYAVMLISLFIIEIIYFKIAKHYHIIDRPNDRSSHKKATIRGGGIIFCFAFLLYPIFFETTPFYFLAGLLCLGLISFLDDLKPRDFKVRMIIHLIAVTLMFVQLGVFSLPVYVIILAVIFAIGTINAVNFMDGINGITGGYSFVTLLTLLYINHYVVNFIEKDFIITALIGVMVFNFFNFRKKAVCFAGDVGSICMAFILVFIILKLVIHTNNMSYISLLLIYGLDVVSTIFFRVLRKENIFEAHRTHLYQYLVNEKKCLIYR